MHLQFPTYITPRKCTDGEEVLGLQSYGSINATGQLPCAHCHLLGFLLEILQPRQPAIALPFLTRGAHHQGKAFLSSQRRGLGACIIHWFCTTVRQSKLAVFCSCNSNSCFQLWSFLVRSARRHLKQRLSQLSCCFSGLHYLSRESFYFLELWKWHPSEKTALENL